LSSKALTGNGVDLRRSVEDFHLKLKVKKNIKTLRRIIKTHGACLEIQHENRAPCRNEKASEAPPSQKNTS